jgi:hypothetical protein
MLDRLFDLLDLFGKVMGSAFVRELGKAIAWAIAFFGPAVFIGYVIEPKYDLGKEGWAWLLFGIWGFEALLWWAHVDSVKKAVEAERQRQWQAEARLKDEPTERNMFP